MRFLHCAEIHLDSPLRGLERYEGAPLAEVRGATRRTFENMVQCALREQSRFSWSSRETSTMAIGRISIQGSFLRRKWRSSENSVSRSMLFEAIMTRRASSHARFHCQRMSICSRTKLHKHLVEIAERSRLSTVISVQNL